MQLLKPQTQRKYSKMISTQTSLLLIIDVQNDFCPGGALAVNGGDEVVPVINQLQEKFENVALTQDWHPAGHSSFASAHPGKSPFEMVELDYGQQNLWPDHCVQGTHGAQFHGDLATDKAQVIVRKGYRAGIDSYSAFFENDQKTRTGLHGYVSERGIKQIYMCGLATDYCVGFSALDGRGLGLEVFVIEDACRAIDMAGSLAAMNLQMAAQGVKTIKAGDLF
jgi:nicotinamidase/pyrazinamidase